MKIIDFFIFLPGLSGHPSAEQSPWCLLATDLLLRLHLALGSALWGGPTGGHSSNIHEMLVVKIFIISHAIRPEHRLSGRRGRSRDRGCGRT